MAKAGDTIFFICPYGGCSAAAVDLLVEAGLTWMRSTIDGVEGDVRNPDLVEVVKPGDRVEEAYAGVGGLSDEPAPKPATE